MKWITAKDIANWANTQQRRCAELLPELVARLIMSTSQNIQLLDFPCGDSISSEGWDGRLETDDNSPFFPSGISGWEIGVEKSAQKKAEQDYEKRSTDSLVLPAEETAFVFVTPRQWPKRAKWAATKQSLGHWKGVRVVAADALEQWLDSAPAVSLWLARHIGKVISGEIRDIESFWEEWSAATDPRFSTQIVVGGRVREVERVHCWIANSPSSLEIQGDSPDEVRAFFYASIQGMEEDDRLKAMSRCLIVENPADIRNCVAAFQHPLIIVVSGRCAEAAGYAISKGHHVLLAVDSKLVRVREIVRLSRPRRKVIETSLREAGKSEADASQIARDFGRSIPVLRRHLSCVGVVNEPLWGSDDFSAVTLPLLLAGAWDEQREGDRRVLGKLVGMGYQEIVGKVGDLCAMDDSPIARFGNICILKSVLDAWFLLSRYISDGLLESFEDIVTEVLTKVHPKYDLAPNERWAAAVHGKESEFSGPLRSGFAESLVLLSVFDDTCPEQVNPVGLVNRMVRKILSSADSCEAWASVSDVTPLLAEAAPEVFLDAVESKLSESPRLFGDLMRDETDAFFDECKHSGLLWALESLAWSPLYCARSCALLSRLANIDPGGRWANRPVNSLLNVFLPRYPRTHAGPDERLAVFSKLCEDHPALAWQMVEPVFTGGAHSESYHFQWRDAGGQRKGVEPESTSDYAAFMRGFRPKLTELACAEDNLVSALQEFVKLPTDIQSALLARLDMLDPTDVSNVVVGGLFHGLRKVLHWINSYGNEQQRANANDLERLLDKFTPDDPLERLGWLLSTPWPDLPSGNRRSSECYDEDVARAQELAVRELYDNFPLVKIINFSRTVDAPGVIGNALGRIVTLEEDIVVLDALLESPAENEILIISYSSARVNTVSPDWAFDQMERLKDAGSYTDETFASILLGMKRDRSTWEAFANAGEGVKSAYWKRVQVRPRQENKLDSIFAIEELLKVGRPFDALKIAGDPKGSLPSQVLRKVVLEVLNVDTKWQGRGANSSTSFYLGSVLDQLQKNGELSDEEIAVLEWPFARVLRNLRHDRSSPFALHRLLQRDPSFFALLVSYAHPRDDRTDNPHFEGKRKQEIRHLTLSAKEVLDLWNLLPGLKDDGSFDKKILQDWISSARQHCAEAVCIKGGDREVAAMLARAPSDPDGRWPHVAVRDAIEQLRNRLIERHIMLGVLNARGTTSRSIGEGGRQERDLAEQCVGRALRSRLFGTCDKNSD